MAKPTRSAGLAAALAHTNTIATAMAEASGGTSLERCACNAQVGGAVRVVGRPHRRRGRPGRQELPYRTQLASGSATCERCAVSRRAFGTNCCTIAGKLAGGACNAGLAGGSSGGRAELACRAAVTFAHLPPAPKLSGGARNAWYRCSRPPLTPEGCATAATTATAVAACELSAWAAFALDCTFLVGIATWCARCAVCTTGKRCKAPSGACIAIRLTSLRLVLPHGTRRTVDGV